MKIVVVAAASLELEPLSQKYKLDIKNGINKITEQIDVLITGMGMMNTAAHLTHYCCVCKPDFIIDAGICGAFNRTLKIGEVMLVKSETYGDFGVEAGEEFKDFFDLGFIHTPQDMQQYGLQRPFGFSNFTNFLNLKYVDSITVNKVHGNETSIAKMIGKYPADIENMEGLAVFYVSNMLKINCLELRSVSNYVEKRNRENWNIPLAVNQLNEKLIQIIDHLVF